MRSLEPTIETELCAANCRADANGTAWRRVGPRCIPIAPSEARFAPCIALFTPISWRLRRGALHTWALDRNSSAATRPQHRGHAALGGHLAETINPHRMTSMSRLSLAVLGVCGLTACSTAQAPAKPKASPASEVTRDLERVRAVTAPFQDIAAAQAAGWPTSNPPCLANPSAGGMGHHYVNRAHIDDKVEVERPEILLYAPDGNGKQKLVAVEYIIPYRIRPRDAEPPTIFGQQLRRSDELSLWYLHVWAWEENANGLFADWNPRVKC